MDTEIMYNHIEKITHIMVYAPRQSQLMLMQKLTTKRLDYYVGITVQERLFGPNAENKLTEDNSDQIEIHPEFNCASSP